MNACSLDGIDPQNRTAWRSGIRSTQQLLGHLQQLNNKNKDQVKSSQNGTKGGFAYLILGKYHVQYVVAHLHIDAYLQNDVQTEGEINVQNISLFWVLLRLILIANTC